MSEQDVNLLEYTIKPVYSGHVTQQNLVIADTFQWNPPNHTETESNSHRKTPIQGTGLWRAIAIADTIVWHRVKSSSQIYLFIADTLYLLWKSKNKMFSNFQMFLFNTLLYFSTLLLTLLYLVSNKEFHKLPEKIQENFAGTRSQNCPKHANFAKFTSRKITQKPVYSRHPVTVDNFFRNRR